MATSKQFPPVCPRCQALAVCFHQDRGGVDYYDEYTLFCFDCGFSDKRGMSGGSPIADSYTNPCPFCGRTHYVHTPPFTSAAHKLEISIDGVLIVDWRFADGTKARQILQAPKTQLVDGKRTVLADQALG